MKLVLLFALLVSLPLVSGCGKPADTNVIERAPTPLTQEEQDALLDGKN